MEKQSNKKVFWYILFAVITVVLCYLFLVVYLYFISPYNISLKLTFWPFQTTGSMGNLYMDSVVEIKFQANEDLDVVEKSVVGVNVREDGFIVAEYDELRSMVQDSNIIINTNSGKIYNGKLLYGDMNYNICILKCENREGDEGSVKIPFVKLKNTLTSGETVAVSLSTEGRQIFDSSIDASRLSYVYSDVAVETYVGVDFIVEDCCDLTVDEQFVDGVIFDKSGGVVGFNWTLSSTKGCVVMPVYAASAFLDDVAWEYYQEKTYSPVLVGKLAGVDYVDIYCHMQVSKSTTDQGEVGREEYFYFSGEWMPYTEAVQNFYRNEQDGVLLIKDFAYKEAEIAADNRIVSVKINSNSYTIETRHDLIDVLYKIYTGDNVTFDFVSVTNSTAGSVTFMA